MQPHADSSVVELLVEALMATQREDAVAASGCARRAGELGSRLGAELAVHLDGGGRRHVYDQPAAFRAFVRGGGNVPLYENLSRALAGHYDRARPGRLLDIGCGDGLALGPALAGAEAKPDTVEVVEPSAGLLRAARERLVDNGCHVVGREVTAQEFVRGLANESRWDLAQATFSLQSVHPDDRLDVLRGLREHTGELLIAEFDTPSFEEGSEEHLRYLAEHYETGIAEYSEDAGLVAQGFMLPILLGLLEPSEERTNWEQPAQVWQNLLAEAGYLRVTVESIYDYWWAPAVLLHAW